MEAVLGFVIGILAVIFAFGFIIFIHELGHFLTARAVDIRCPQFAIGFGPSLFSFRWRGTNFAVRAFPFGGYVLMNGEEPGDRTEDPWADAVAYYLGEVEFPATPAKLLEVMEKVPKEERAEAWLEVHDQVAFARCAEFPTLQSVEGNFHDRPVSARILVISGGVIMNFISTILILWCLGPMVGSGSFFREWAPYVSQAVAGSPAADADIVAGDLFLEVGGQEMATYLQAFHTIGRSAGVPVKMKVQKRDGSTVDLEVRPDLRIGNETYRVTEDSLILKSSVGDESLKDKIVASPDRATLVEQTEALVGQKEASYELQLKGEDSPRKFKLPEEFDGPRGQLGVLFGVNDIRFEDKFKGYVATVASGSLGEKAGLKPGDQIVGVNGLFVESNSGFVFGSLIDDAVVNIAQIPEIDEFEFLVLRDGKVERLNLKKEASIESLESLGVALEPFGTADIVRAPFSMIGQMLSMPYMVFKIWISNQATGKEIVSNLQGPVGIMQLIYNVHDNGLAQFLYFVALLNAAIGAFNLLPFPALDGSRLVFLIIAGLRGKPLDPDKEARIHLAGLMVLLGFVVIVTFGDIKRLFSADIFVL